MWRNISSNKGGCSSFQKFLKTRPSKCNQVNFIASLNYTMIRWAYQSKPWHQILYYPKIMDGGFVDTNVCIPVFCNHPWNIRFATQCAALLNWSAFAISVFVEWVVFDFCMYYCDSHYLLTVHSSQSTLEMVMTSSSIFCLFLVAFVAGFDLHHLHCNIQIFRFRASICSDL